MLKDPRYTPIENSSSLIAVAGEVLRLLTKITKSLRDNDQVIPELESVVNLSHDGLAVEILKKLDNVVTVLQPTYPDGDPTGDSPRLVMFLCRVLHFVLALPSTWTTQFRDYIDRYSGRLTMLLKVSGLFLKS